MMLKEKLEQVLNASGATPRAEEVSLENERPKAAVKPAPVAKKKDVNFDDDEESLSYFAKLANDD